MDTERIERVPVHGLPLRGALRVVSRGSGPALVYLHGAGDSGALLPALHTLSTSFRVIRPDHPGFLSGDDLGCRTIAELALAHHRLLDVLEVDEFVLVGCSLGGWAAAELALRIPERVRQLVLIDPAGLPGDGTAPDIFTLDAEEILKRTVHDEGSRAAARAATPDETVREGLARSLETARRLAGDPYMHDPGLAARVSALRMPVQLVWGQDDGIIPLSYASDWTAKIPGARLHVIAQAGHLPHVEQPEEFLSAIALAESAGGAVQWS